MTHIDKRVLGDPVSWLCEPDQLNPSIRYFALRDLLGKPATDPDVVRAKAAVMASGPVPAILEAQHPEGYWERPGHGYGKYRGTDWQIMLLAELGSDPTDERVRRGCQYLLGHSIAAGTGGFSYTASSAPSGVVHCLNGNLLSSLIRLGFLDDARVQRSIEWQARAITGEDSIPYYRSGTSGPDFACGINQGQPCAWGATKALKALIWVPEAQRSPVVSRALSRGAEFLMSHNLARADYPYTQKVSSTWFKLGFPLSYWSDVLETLAVLTALGRGTDPRLSEAWQWLLSKQDSQGRWRLENSLNGKMWIDIEKRGQPSKWITLRALRVLKELQSLPQAQ
jgi:hypothetical protein